MDLIHLPSPEEFLEQTQGRIRVEVYPFQTEAECLAWLRQGSSMLEEIEDWLRGHPGDGVALHRADSQGVLHLAFVSAEDLMAFCLRWEMEMTVEKTTS